MIEVRSAGHRRHHGVQVPGSELRRQMVIKHAGQPARRSALVMGIPDPEPGRDLPGTRPAGRPALPGYYARRQTWWMRAW